ncbi:hypothetical protein ACQP1W_38910 [Spirillospora sp. CA-255316]
MTVFSGLVRRAALEAERRLRAGVDLLAAIAEDPERTADLQREREARAEQEARIRRLEEIVERVLEGHDRDLGALRTDLDSLITQLNDRLLPRIDERMHDTERDLTALATGLVRSGREAASTRTRLEAVENRVADLRERLVRMEQRAGLWRDLQATMARLGDDIDTLRTRLNVRSAPAPQVAATPQPATPAAAASPSLGEGGPQQLNAPDAHSQAS